MHPIKTPAPARPADVLKIIEIITMIATILVALFVGYGLWLYFVGSGRP